ncbi:hypothetical protein [Streptomyces sp. NPDC047000]|uniref:hypothetical protein n=1 Tax=Streptomyces sp. NPDC047000 TaxID=3155474 RepID=UPI0034101092
MDYPYVSVNAIDVTNVESRMSVELHFGGESLPGVTQEDVVNAVKALFAQQPNVTVNALRFEVTASPV